MLIKYAAILLYCQLGLTLLIPHVLKPRIFSLRSTKQRLQATINPLVPTRKFKKEFSIFTEHDEKNKDERIHSNETIISASSSALQNDNFVIIPKELINPTMFSTLGLNKLFDLADELHQEHVSHKWMNFSLHDQIYIPHEFKTYFIFNTSSIKQSMGLDMIHNLQKQKQDEEQQQSFSSHTLNKFLSHIVPFDIPELVELVDYYMVLPNLPHLSNLTSAIYHEGLLSYPMSQLPVFRSQLSGDKPLIVFMFNETDTSSDSINTASISSLHQQHLPQHKSDPNLKSSTTQIMSIKNYLKSPTTFSTFFDKFARDWIDQVDYDSLVHSVFCNVNNQDEDHSFCLKLRQQVVDIEPAFKKFVAMSDPNVVDRAASMVSQRHKGKGRDGAATFLKLANDEYDDVKVHAQAVRQVHDKLQAKKHALTMAGTTGINLIRDPKTVIHQLDDYIDDKLDTQLNKLETKKQELWDTLDDKKDAVLSSIDDKKSTAIELVRDGISDRKSAAIESVRDTISDTKSDLFDEFDVASEGGKLITTIDDKRQHFTDLIQRKAEDLQTWTFKPQLFEKKKGNGDQKYGVLDKLKSKLNRDDEHDSDYDHPAFNSESSSDEEENNDQFENDKGKKRYINQQRSTNSHRQRNKKRYISDASIQPGLGEYIEQGGFSLPLSLLNYKNPMANDENIMGNFDDVLDDNESKQPPRKTTYSQVMNLDTLSPMNSKRSSTDDEEGGDAEEPCQPITWYNIFHHSVFGEPNFCNE
ncbi:hypothetical protein I9W82_002380 [Candida metapsilosis]|uniref:Uncharacterized protein n=1 Tax=Candida metapsilosis TaxID=273372 RepID=A0A8H8DC71_9ASCO|nr:hypothetical protein I9W82_002380 [Candida metapsilosis]